VRNDRLLSPTLRIAPECHIEWNAEFAIFEDLTIRIEPSDHPAIVAITALARRQEAHTSVRSLKAAFAAQSELPYSPILDAHIGRRVESFHRHIIPDRRQPGQGIRTIIGGYPKAV
jgi:hypothetical protein